MHLLLAVAAVLVGWTMPIKALAAMTVAGHGLLRPPQPARGRVVVRADGSCTVQGQSAAMPLGERTLLCPFWARLDLGSGRRDILLIADQVRPEEWRRLRAILRRTRCV